MDSKTDSDTSQLRFKSDADVSSELGQRGIGDSDGDLTTRIGEDDVHIHREAVTSEIPVQKDADETSGQEDAGIEVTDVTDSNGKTRSTRGESEELCGHKRDGNETFTQRGAEGSEIPNGQRELLSQADREASRLHRDKCESPDNKTDEDERSYQRSAEVNMERKYLNVVTTHRNGNLANCSDGDMNEIIDQSDGDLDEVANCWDREVEEIIIDFSEDVAITSKEDVLLTPSKKGEELPQAASQSSSEREAVSSITFHDLSYEVTQRKCCKRLPNKVILDSVRLE